MHYIAFYKPYNVLCQFSPEGLKQTLAHHLPNIAKDIYPIGRLDYDSEGLLLLSNDKRLNNLLLKPEYAHPRTYYVQVEGIPSPEAIDTLQKGVTINIKGKLYHTQPCHASIVTAEPNLPPRTPPIRFRKSVPDCWLSLTLTEGKNRQVRHITAAVGHPTLRLVRYAIDNITINGLLPGNYRPLSPAEVKGLLAWRSP